MKDGYIATAAYAGYGTLHCTPGYGSCPGSAGGNCWPNFVWSGTLTTAGTNAYDRDLETGNFIENAWVPHDITNAFSVRCVLDVNFFV